MRGDPQAVAISKSACVCSRRTAFSTEIILPLTSFLRPLARSWLGPRRVAVALFPGALDPLDGAAGAQPEHAEVAAAARLHWGERPSGLFHTLLSWGAAGVLLTGRSASPARHTALGPQRQLNRKRNRRENKPESCDIHSTRSNRSVTPVLRLTQAPPAGTVSGVRSPRSQHEERNLSPQDHHV